MGRKSAPEVAGLGEQIRRERLRQGLSLKQIEQRAGISPTHVSEIERGRSSPTVGALAKIALALDRPLSRLVESRPAAAIAIGQRRQRRTWLLAGGAVRLHTLLGARAPIDLTIGWLELAPGAALGEDEGQLGARELVLHQLQGRLQLVVSGAAHALGRGDTIHCRDAQLGRLWNAGAREARALLIAYPRLRL